MKTLKSESRWIKEINKTIVVDWLELSFKGTIPTFQHNPKQYRLNGNCYIEYIDCNNKFFRTVVNLFIDYRKIGELRMHPKTPFINDEVIQFKFENHLLYGNEYLNYINYLVEVLGFEFQHIVRIDIAIDTINHNIIEFMKNYQYSDNIKLKGKPKSIDIKTYGKDYKTIHFGSISSEKYIKMYNKTEELKSSDKSYIQEFWKLNGLDFINNKVERFELTLKQKQAKELNVFGLNNSDYLASIVRTHTKNYFEFQKVIVNHKKEYIKDVTPINLNEFKTVLLSKYKYIPQGSIKPVKMEIKRLFINSLIETEIINSNSPNQDISEQIENESNKVCFKAQQDFYKSINRLVELYDLKQYYHSNIPFWKSHFEKNMSIYLQNIQK